MRRQWWIIVLAAVAVCPTVCPAENLAKEIKKAVERSTLDQPGTKAFHIRASLAPSFERDKESGRTGEVEIWWVSPTQWKREVRSPEFHQIEIVDGAHDWQKNEGDYFPQWLQQTAEELIRPVPPLNEVLEQAERADVRRIGADDEPKLDYSERNSSRPQHLEIVGCFAEQHRIAALCRWVGLGCRVQGLCGFSRTDGREDSKRGFASSDCKGHGS